MSAPNFVYVTYIKTTPKKLWHALTRGDFMVKYWHAKIQSTWKPGAKVQTFMRSGKLDWDGKVLKCQPYRLLSFTFQILGFQKRSSRVVFEIEKMGKEVKVTFMHYGIEPRCRPGISGGWPVFFSSLKSVLETGKGMKIPG